MIKHIRKNINIEMFVESIIRDKDASLFLLVYLSHIE